MPQIRFESQAHIFGIAIKQVETAQYWLRQAILKNDDRLLTNATLALHFVYKHATQKDLTPTLDVFFAVTKISRYLMTKNKRYLLDALRDLDHARQRLFDLMQFARLHRLAPTPGDLPSWKGGFYFNYNLFAKDLLTAAWVATYLYFLLAPIAKAPAALRAIFLRRQAIAEAERLMQEFGPVIRREVPHLWRQVIELVREIKGLKPPP